jgi:D-arabinose 1-dehydrogenase-like Zn-dependent alcohol dehydrogenase
VADRARPIVKSTEEDILRVAVVTGPGVVELHDEPNPTVGPDEVLVEVGACGLCTM